MEISEYGTKKECRSCTIREGKIVCKLSRCAMDELDAARVEIKNLKAQLAAMKKRFSEGFPVLLEKAKDGCISVWIGEPAEWVFLGHSHYNHLDIRSGECVLCRIVREGN